MSSEAAIELIGVQKVYPIYQTNMQRLKFMLWRSSKDRPSLTYALRGIDLKINKGEVFGLIGQNGSGKSTLLQIIAKTLLPTFGTVNINGRVAAMLELGAGFHPDFTGRENIYFNAAVLGLSRQEVDQKINRIISFADIGPFIDQPVKTYSSGMYARLGFAVQSHVDADVIIIDEALAVGDVFFRQKCYRRLDELRENGATVLLVSHSMGEVEQHCDRAALLRAGEIMCVGSPSDVIKTYYLAEQQSRLGARAAPESQDKDRSPMLAHSSVPKDACFKLDKGKQFNSGQATCILVALIDANGHARRVFKAGETATFIHEYEVHDLIHGAYAGLVVHSDTGVIVHGRNTLQCKIEPERILQPGQRLRIRQDVTLSIAAGEYTFEVGLGAIGEHELKDVESWTVNEFHEHRTRVVQATCVGSFNVIWPDLRGVDAQPFYGLTSLAGRSVVDAELSPTMEKQRVKLTPD